MGQVDCWPMQCPPMLPAGAGDCADSSADYNNPVADCCAPRCDQKAALVASSISPTTTTAVTAADPCSQQQLNVYHGNGTGGGSNLDSNSGNGNIGGGNDGNSTLLPAAIRPCLYAGRVYQSGARWDDPADMCTSCDCKVMR